MSRKKKGSFPEEIFVKWESDRSDEESKWLLADERQEGFAILGDTQRIAVYKLVELRDVTGVIETTTVVE